MGHEKDLNDEVHPVREGTPLYIFAEKLVRYVDTVRRFLKKPSPRKKGSDCGTYKNVTATDLRTIVASHVEN